MDKTDDLGLPIEYQVLPQFFDAHNVSADTDEKNAVIESLLKQHQVRTVYDITCGTGSQVFYLAKRNYHVVGSDLCPDLIAQARGKALQLQLDTPLLVADMRDSQLGEFDAVISIFSAIGHLSRQDFVRSLQNIRDNLGPGGIYVFDIFNLQALTDAVMKTFVMDISSEQDGLRFRNRQTSELDRNKGWLISHDHYCIEKPGQPEKNFTNTFRLQIYTAPELNQLLLENGFEVIGQYDMQGKDFMPEESLNILTVARKTP